MKRCRLLAHFLDVLVRRGVKRSLAGGIGKRHLAGVGHFDGRVGFLFAQRALASDGSDDVAEVALGGGGELRFAAVTANGNGLRVSASDGRARGLAGDGADGVQRLGGRGKASQQAESGEEGEEVFHGGRGGMADSDTKSWILRN